MLNNCIDHGTISKMNENYPQKFASPYTAIFRNYINERIKSGKAISTTNREIFYLNKFSEYFSLIKLKSLNDLTSSYIIGFMQKFSLNVKPETLGGAATCLRLLLDYLYRTGCLDNDLSIYVPKVNRRAEHIPSTYAASDIKKMLERADRSGPKGKRDFAMLILAARLGMRASDICNLTLDNIKWQQNSIEFISIKTSQFVSLPLLNDVGEAIIDYLKHGRCESDSKHLFLCFATPVRPLKPSNLHGIVGTATRNADIHLLAGTHRGPHALRASLASEMLNNNTPLPVISEALSHKNTNTTRIYLKIDIEQLRAYALDIPSLGNIWMGVAK